MKHNTQLKLSLLTVAFAFLGSAVCTEAVNYVTVFSDGFESYGAGGVTFDKNHAGPNAAPNGSGNPWFGPGLPNCDVVGTEGSVTPHSGVNMVRGIAPNDFDQDYYNLAYRLHGGNVFLGNVMLDWWFYDPLGSGGSNFRDYMALVDYLTSDGTTDYSPGGTPGSAINQRFSLGASNPAGFDNTKYQARVVGATDGLSGAATWFNLNVTRSVGWHHGRIIVGGKPPTGAPDVSFYIDDMVNPALTHNAMQGTGYNFIEINASFGPTTGYFDDISFGVAIPPNLTITLSGNNAILTWPGFGFTLQSASDVTGPYTDVTGAVSGYGYDTTSGPQQFFRLRN